MGKFLIVWLTSKMKKMRKASKKIGLITRKKVEEEKRGKKNVDNIGLGIIKI